MTDHLQTSMAEATALTKAGRLSEATALIQRSLGGSSTPLVRHPDDGAVARPGIPAGSRRSARPRPAARGHRPVVGRSVPHVARPADGDAPSGLAGRTSVCTYTGAAGSRTYRLSVPSRADGGPMPLLVLLHGGTQTAMDFAAGTRMSDHADAEGFLVAYPEQPPSANAQRCWNWFRPGDQQRDAGEPSLLAGIVAQIAEDHRVDASRVFVAGLSAGGAMAAVMAAAYPDVFAAAAVHSGLASGAASDLPSAFAAMGSGARGAPLARRIPLLVVHGDADRTVHPANADALVAQFTGGRHDGDVEEGRRPGGHRYTRVSYAARDGHPAVERWTVHGSGHAWSGGDARGSYVDPQGPDASAEMVRFFREVTAR